MYRWWSYRKSNFLKTNNFAIIGQDGAFDSKLTMLALILYIMFIGGRKIGSKRQYALKKW